MRKRKPFKFKFSTKDFAGAEKASIIISLESIKRIERAYEEIKKARKMPPGPARAKLFKENGWAITAMRFLKKVKVIIIVSGHTTGHKG